MDLLKKFEQEYLQVGEQILLKDTASLGCRAWHGYDFSLFDSTLYITNARLAIVTPKPSAIVKAVYEALVSVAGLSLDVPTVKPIGKQAINRNPNEGNILSIPFNQITKVELRNKTKMFIPAGIVVLNFSNGTELPILFNRELGAGADRWNVAERAKAFLNLINQQKSKA